MTKPTVVIPPYRMGGVQGKVRVWDGNGRTMAEFPAGEQGWADARAIRDALTYFETYGEIYTEDQKVTCLQNSLIALIVACRDLILNPVSSNNLKALILVKNEAQNTLDHLGVKIEIGT